MDIFNVPLIESINRHVALGWASTHYLSFTESVEIAQHYARGKRAERLVECDSENWESAVFTIDTGLFHNVTELEGGIYQCLFYGRRISGDTKNIGYMVMRYLANRDKLPCVIMILLIDLARYLVMQQSNDVHLLKAYANATRDKEWLILPLDPPQGDPYKNVGLTACLDDGCVINCAKYRYSN